MNGKTRILGIAPYEGMRSLLQRAAEQREDVDLTVHVGDLEVGAEIASRYTLADFDIILSRGGTAELISTRSPIPVVEIELSAYDILRAIKLAENYDEPYAIIGYSSITKSAQFLCNLFHYEIDIYTIRAPGEVQGILTKLSDAGCRMVLCDVITNSQAQRMGMRSILFVSGAESIEAALYEAVKTAERYRGLIASAEFFKSLVEDNYHEVFVYNEKEELVYTSQRHSFSPSVLDAMKACVAEILEERLRTIYKDEGHTLFAIRGVRKQIFRENYVVYYINTRKVPLSMTKSGIRYIDKAQALEQYYASLFSYTRHLAAHNPPPDQLTGGGLPIMILGEKGTGHAEAASYLYAQGKRQNKTMAVIDCSRITEKGWSFLTEHANSPLGDTRITIFFKEARLLSDRQFHRLLSIIEDLNLHKQNTLLFSYITAEGEPLPERCQRLLNRFGCLTFDLLPLRARSEEIPGLISMHISNLNMELAREIVGLEPEATVLLQSYAWPGNYEQFGRIMTELFSLTDTPYISAASVSRLLLRETPAAIAAPVEALDLSRPLSEINLDIALHVLRQEKGNHRAAAKRLGISRTTLWRMLQRSDAK